MLRFDSKPQNSIKQLSFNKKKLFFFLSGDFPGGSVIKNPPANAGNIGDEGSIPGSGRSPGVENGNPLQYPCLENSMDRGTWRAAVHGVAESCT